MMTQIQLSEFRYQALCIAYFCHLRAGKWCFVGWPAERLRQYVMWHMAHGTIEVMRVNGEITSVGFAWPDRLNDIRNRMETGLAVFRWERTTEPDCVFIAEVIGDKDACKHFIVRARQRWPEHQHFMTFRREKLVELTSLMIRMEAHE